MDGSQVEIQSSGNQFAVSAEDFRRRYLRDRKELSYTISHELTSAVRRVISTLSLVEEELGKGNTARAMEYTCLAQDKLLANETALKALLTFLKDSPSQEPFCFCEIDLLLKENLSEFHEIQVGESLLSKEYKICIGALRNTLRIILESLQPGVGCWVKAEVRDDQFLEVQFRCLSEGKEISGTHWQYLILVDSGNHGFWKKGLAVARNIAEQNGGSLDILKLENEKNQICLTWPLGEGKEKIKSGSDESYSA